MAKLHSSQGQCAEIIVSLGAKMAGVILATATWISTGLAQGTQTNVITGQISAPGEQAVYAFTVATNGRYYFDALTNSAQLVWSLNGPEGAVVSSRSFANTDAQSVGDPTLGLGPGDYTLVLQSSGGTTNTYQFRFLNLADATLLTPGTVVSNTLAPANRTDAYQFTAAAGDRYYFQQITRTGLPNTWWRLFDPYGNQVFSQNFTDVGSTSAPLTLPSAGTYTLLLEGYINDTGTGTYAFKLVPEGNNPPAPFTGTAMNLGDLITGQLASQTTNYYIFTLTHSTWVVVDQETNSPNLTWSLQGPSGWVVNQQGLNASGGINNFGPLALPAGNYQLRLQGNAANSYRFRLLDLASAQPLTLGAPTLCTLNPASSSSLYRFNLAAGARFYFDSLGATNLPNAIWRLVDPLGVVVFDSYAGNNQGPFALNVAGTYTLLVQGYWGDPGSGTFGFNVSPTADGLQALTLGSVVTGAIASPGQRQQYTFTLASDARLYFDALTNSYRLQWSLDGPTGNQVNSRSFNGSDAQSVANPILTLPAGDYTLTVFANSDTVGGFQFRLFDLATATAMTPGATINGTLNPANATVAYQFTVAATGKFFYNYLSSTGLPDTYLRLVDAYGNVPLTTGLGSDAGPFVLVAGSYTLLVEGYIGDSGSGIYSFSLAPVSDGRQPLTLGSVTSGAITTPGQQQLYTFTLAGATRLYFDSLTNFPALHWSLDGPAGNVVNVRGFNGSDAQTVSNPILLAAPGDYVLTVDGYGDSVGNFQFRLFDLATALPLTPGAPVQGTLQPANSTVAYQFQVSAPGKFYYDYQGSTNLPDTFVRLADAYGNILQSTSLSTGTGPFALFPGNYTLLIEGYINDAGNGTYSFTLWPVVDGAQALTLGNVTTGAISAPGQHQQFTFTLSSASRLYFDALTNNPNLQWSLDGPAGNTVNSRSFNSSDAQSIGNPVWQLPAGFYTLTIAAQGDMMPSFQFRLLDLAAATLLSPGTPVNTNNFVANSTALYRFDAVAGDQYFFASTSATGIPNAFWRLIDPYNNIVFGQSFSSSAGTNRLFAAGTYTVLIEGYIGDSGLGAYGFNVLPAGNVPVVPYTGSALQVGSTISGTLATAGATNAYVLTVTNAGRFYFDALTNASLFWSLQGPPGTLVNQRSFLNSDGPDIADPVLVLPAGVYQLALTGGPGDYQFRWLDLLSAAPYTLGTVISNTLSPAESSSFYQFTATAGQQVYFHPQPVSGTTYAPYARLYGPLGNMLMGNYLNSDVDTLVLPQSGAYTLTVEGRIYDTRASGDYVFSLLPVSYPTNTLQVGATVQGTLTTLGQRTVYTFSLAGAATLYFDALTNANFIWRLDAAAGPVVNWRPFNGSDGPDIGNPLLPLSAGAYTLTVAGSSFAVMGDYRFRLLNFGSAISFTPGTVVSNNLAPANSTVFYQFNGQAGQQMYFHGASTGFTYQPYCRLYAPAGAVLEATYLNQDVDTFTLPQSGLYTLSVEGRVYETAPSGAVVFNLLPVSYPTNSLTIGALASGTVSTLGQRQFYTFTLPAAARLYFDALTNADFWWRLDGPWGQVVNWRSFRSADGPDVGNPLLALPAGAYTLAVAGDNFAVTGDYRFQLLNFANATAFTPGTVVSNSLSPADSTVLYQFNGTLGDQYYFKNLGSSGFAYQPYCRLYAPYGGIVVSGYVNADINTFSLPQSGTYTLTVEGRIYDSNPSGSFAFNLVPNPPTSVQLLFPSSQAPDLVVVGVAVTPTTGLQSGGQATISWTDQNTGTGPTSGSFSDRVTIRNLATGAVLADGILLYRESDPGNGPLAAGTSRNRQMTLSLPDGTNSVGTLQATVTVDTLNNIPESNEANNAASANFNVTLAPYPDLQVTQLHAVPATGWTPGSTVTISWRLINTGSGPASQSWQDSVVVLNTNTSVVILNTTTNYNLADAGNGPIAPGDGRDRSLSFTVPNDANASGVFAVTVMADSANQLFEYNLSGTAKSNNSTSIMVISAPDLVPGGLSVSPSAGIQSGSALTIRWTDTNAGTANCNPAFYDRVTIVNTNTTETLLNTTVYYDPNAAGNGSIPPGGTRPRSATFTVPDGARGVGTLLVTIAVDTYNQVAEANNTGTGEANNTVSLSLFSSIAPYPDLQVVNLAVVPAALAPGTNLTVSWQDTNSGSATAVGFWQDRVTIVNQDLGVTLLDTAIPYDPAALGPLTNGTARARSYNFTLPSGPNSSGGLLFTVTADAYNNIFEYNPANTGESNNTASLFRVSSSAVLPDLIITSLTAPNTALSGQTISVHLRLLNQGLVAANADMVQRVFISSVPVAGTGTLAGQADYNGTLGVGQTLDQTLTVLLPAVPGTYWLVGQADVNNNVAEISEQNNYFVAPVPITVQPAYQATVTADVHQALAGTAIPMHGQATLGGSGTPAALVPVTLHVLVRGTDRTYTGLTDPNGRFTNVFQPLPNEAGVYQIAAAIPGQQNVAPQDSFVLLGMAIAPVGLVSLTEGGTVTNVTPVNNLSDVPLTQLNVTVVTNQPNLAVVASLATNQLAGFGSANLSLRIQALNPSIYQSPVLLRISSAEGATADLTLIVQVAALQPRLVPNPLSLQGAMQRGAQTPVAFSVLNQGGAATGPLQVVPPAVPWLALASPSQLPPLGIGSNTVVTLLLKPAADLPLGDYNGTLVMQSTNAAVQVPFTFRAVSTAHGNLQLTAEDEYTYFAAGAPRLTNAQVVLTDALSGTPVVTNWTGADGTVLFSNLLEAYYLVDVNASAHGPFRDTALVVAGQTTNVMAFLTRQTVSYDFTVVPTTIPDQYIFSINSTFETQVPIPVVTIDPASLDLAQYPGTNVQVMYTIANHGLIDAEHVYLNFPDTALLHFTVLSTNLGKLAANSSITVPVLIQRLAAPGGAALQGKTRGLEDVNSGQCSVTASMLWDYLCGPNVVNKDTAAYVFDSTGCNLVDLYFQVYHLEPDNPNPAGGGSPGITTQQFVDYLNQFQPVTDFEPPPGYHFACNATPPAALMRLTGYSPQGGNSATSVCAKVQMRLDQKGVITRSAFTATLEINNDETNILQNLSATLQVSDLAGTLVTTNFAVSAPTLSGLSAVDGSGVLAANSKGSASWTLIPTLDAAPTNNFTVYLVGGTLSYSQNGTTIHVPLAPAPIQVFPQPELIVRYFHDRDVFADDPFTPQIEPSLPYTLAVQVNNAGYGAADSLKITGGKPQIVDNVKGLLVDFTVLGTQLENQNVTPALTVDFGHIDPGTNKIARWLFTSSIQGSFTNFSASFSEVDNFGKPRLSLVRSTEIHELNHVVDAGGPFEDGRPDFLVNDVSDPDFLPDTLYLSSGNSVPVAAVTNATILGALSASQLSLTVTAAPPAGWTYFRFADPGPGTYRLARVLRTDHSEVPFRTNVWTTDRSFRGGDKVPILTNLIHLLDYNSSGAYTLIYTSATNNAVDTIPPTSTVTALPASSPPNFTVQWSGSDNAGGSGIAYYDIYVSINHGAFTPWITNTTLTAATYAGTPNTTYGFFSRATDAAGNQEALHSTPDATTTAVANSPPVMATIPTQSVLAGALFSLTPVATAPDVPPQTLAWSLLAGAPPGALLAPTSGHLTWQTTLADGGTTNRFTLVVTDSGSPSLSVTQAFLVVVNPLNHPPTIAAHPPIVHLDSGSSVSLQLVATDPDSPPQTLTWLLGPGTPSGLVLNPFSGLLTWTPSAAQAPSTNVLTVIVQDSGLPPLGDTNTLAIVVNAVNHPPVLNPIADQTASVLLPLSFKVTATDPDLPAQTLTYSLDPGAPDGAIIDSLSGMFYWTPSRGQGPSTNHIIARVTDSGLPALSDTKSFTVTVGDYLELSLGSTILSPGQTGAVAIALNTTRTVTNLTFTLHLPGSGLTNLALTPPQSPLAVASLQQTGPTDYQARFSTLAGQNLAGNQALGSLGLTATGNGSSAFLPLAIANLVATQADGSALVRTIGDNGRVVFVNQTPLLVAGLNNQQTQITLYGPPGPSYTLVSTPSLRPPVVWAPIWKGAIDARLFQTIPVAATNTTSFFRATVP